MTLPVEIPKRGRRCRVCAKALGAGRDYYSCLAIDEEGVRNDYCLDCWGADVAKGSSIHWHGKVPERPKKREMKDRDEQAMAWLGALLRREGSEPKEEAFILALYLQRRKRLALRREGKEVHLYEEPHSGTTVQVPVVSLTQLRTQEIQKSIAEKLQRHPDDDEEAV